VAALAAAFACVAPTAHAEDSPADVMIVTVNAHQRDYDDARMHELTNGIATRTPEAPDVILVDEILGSGITAMRDQLNEAMGASYETVGSTNSVKVKILLNAATMTRGQTRTWPDVCDPGRVYQVVTATDRESGASMSISGVHFAPSFNDGGSDDCKQSNAAEARRQMAAAGNSGVVGDFNKRYGADYYECNPNEDGDPLPWWSEMTEQSAVDGRSYTDTVRAVHYGRDMASQWSWENAQPETLCTGDTGYRRSRIDYIFVSSETAVVDAAVDQGWGSAVADGSPGCEPAPQCRYSDHRFVWALVHLPDQ
jgi:endonuclease/exonuclease/phosphatase family metal-dependent hydrolase